MLIFLIVSEKHIRKTHSLNIAPSISATELDNMIMSGNMMKSKLHL